MLNKIIEELEIKAEVTHIFKNGVECTGLILGDGSVRPVIYESEIAKIVAKELEKLYANADVPNVDADMIATADYARKNLRFRLRAKANPKSVSRQFLGLAKELVMEVQEDAVALVTQTLLDATGLTEKEAFAIAEQNMRGTYGITEMPAFLPESPLRLVSKAEGLCDNKLFKSYCEDLHIPGVFILPSSIFELLLVNDDGTENVTVDSLREMVREVNDAEVKPEERLSYDVYYYSLATGKVTVAR